MSATRSIVPILGVLLITILLVPLVMLFTQDENIVTLINPVYENGKVTMLGCIENTQKCHEGSEEYLYSVGERCVLRCADKTWQSQEISNKYAYRSGYYCAVREKSIPAYERGSYLGIDFHKIDCDGTVGFIDTKYVKLYGKPFQAERLTRR